MVRNPSSYGDAAGFLAGLAVPDLVFLADDVADTRSLAVVLLGLAYCTFLSVLLYIWSPMTHGASDDCSPVVSQRLIRCSLVSGSECNFVSQLGYSSWRLAQRTKSSHHFTPFQTVCHTLHVVVRVLRSQGGTGHRPISLGRLRFPTVPAEPK